MNTHFAESTLYLNATVLNIFDSIDFPTKTLLQFRRAKDNEQRTRALLFYVQAMQAVLLHIGYLTQPNVAHVGHSILRGFLGSEMVIDPAHNYYSTRQYTSQHHLEPQKRTHVTQCGSLVTVPEHDSLDEYDHRLTPPGSPTTLHF